MNQKVSVLIRARRLVLVSMLAAAIAGLAWASPMPFREYADIEQRGSGWRAPIGPQARTEWVFGRLMYPESPSSRWYWGGDWRQGGTSWTIDYPRSDRNIAEMIRRLTVIDARPVEQPISLDDGDDVFYWPWLYLVEGGSMALTDAQVAKLREYLLRGGFLMVDDFHGTREWALFAQTMQRLFPGRPIIDVPPDDPIFNTIWPIDDFSQIPGELFLHTGLTYEVDGYTARWRGIYDDQGRIMVMILHNMDLGDAVENADNPAYPEEYSSRAMRVFINFVVYAMTH